MRLTTQRVFKRLFSLASCVVFLMLAGCSKDDFTDLNQYIRTVKAKPKSGIDPLPERKPIEPFAFKAENERDPFKPLDQASNQEDKVAVVVANGSGIRPDTNRRKEELEAFPLDSLKMVGTVVMNSTLWGLIKVDNTIYRVRTGNYMGKNYGKIIHIDTDKIEVMEMVSDKPGVWREQQASLVLADDVRGKK
ncbi:MAG: pilus assembly protein PilP [Methylococcaceae bacterium]